ncbi:hypothetical protein SAMN05192533_101291 [Mesobacillus persicus]|uniref:Uncharacterized protein n=1 Tax=Mesobacillus persicus TaxID=930146 RepID=A0A1H7W7Y0_9BACI|nr:hypothetical protein [Mesobacillus persicus]SEM17189.1 hypothetical protein SAMN05192533_101291 [Mesobacillus persicus]
MSLFSIVAREDFISIVLDCNEFQSNDDQYPQEMTIFREITPNQSFYIFAGQIEYGEASWEVAKALSVQDLKLIDIANIIHDYLNRKDRTSAKMEAVIGGVSENGEIQYHIITDAEEVQSHYPKIGESLYYANDLSYRLNPMEELARKLMMEGMSSIKQAQTAQLALLRKFTGARAGNPVAQCMVVEKQPH